MLLSELEKFIHNKSTDDCNKGIQIRLYKDSDWLSLQLTDTKWEAVKWFCNFFVDDPQLHKIRFTPKKNPEDSLDGHVFEFQGRVYELREVEE